MTEYTNYIRASRRVRIGAYTVDIFLMTIVFLIIKTLFLKTFGAKYLAYILVFESLFGFLYFTLMTSGIGKTIGQLLFKIEVKEYYNNVLVAPSGFKSFLRNILIFFGAFINILNINARMSSEIGLRATSTPMVNTLFSLLGCALIIDFVMFLFSENKAAFHDTISNTVVVKTKKTIKSVLRSFCINENDEVAA